MAYVPWGMSVPQSFVSGPAFNSGGTLSAFLAGTSTPTPMYSSSAGAGSTTVITLDARGEPTTIKMIYLDSAITYKFVWKDSSGSTLYTLDNMVPGDSGLRSDLAEHTLNSTKGFHLVSYPLKSGEANVTNYEYPYGDIRRYGGIVGQDCTTAINRALTYNGVAELPEGDIYVSQIIITGSGNSAVFGKTIRGKGIGATNLIGTGGYSSIIRFGTTGGWVDEPNLQEYRADFCGLELLTISATGTYTYGIECHWLTNSTFYNVSVSDGGYIGKGLYLNFSWDNDFHKLTLSNDDGLVMGPQSPNRNTFYGLRVAGGGSSGIGVDYSGSSNAFYGLDASGYNIGVASSNGGYGLTVSGGYFESNAYDISLGGSSISGISITGNRFIVGTGANVAIRQSGSGNVRGMTIEGNVFTDKTSCFKPTSNCQRWIVQGNDYVTCTATWDPVGTGGTLHIVEDIEIDFTPTFTSLTTTGSPTYAGTYVLRGKTIFYKVVITGNGGTTASTAGTTYFTGLPTAATPGGSLVAVSSAIASYGVGLVTGIYAYTPTWAATGNQVIITGEFSIA